MLFPPLQWTAVYIFSARGKLYAKEVNRLTGKKAFWLSFALTLGILIPLYAAALFLGSAGLQDPTAAAAGEGVGLAVRRPDAGDSKNLLLAVRQEEGSTFVLLRFDALQEKVCVMPLPSDLLLPAQEDEIALAAQDAHAGPGVAAMGLAQLLGIRIDHYLSIEDQTLVSLAQQMGNISLDPQWSELQRLALPEGEGGRVVLSAPAAAELIQAAAAQEADVTALRARLYSEFLLVGMDRLNTIIPDFLRGEGGFSTSILATDIYDYQRILDYLALLQPEMLWAAPQTEPAQGGCTLTSEALEQAAQMFQ